MLTCAAIAAVGAGAYLWLIHAPEPAPPAYALDRLSMEVDGRTRDYELFVPRRHAPMSPLLLAFHGSMGDPSTIRRRTGYRFEALAERRGFVIAYPQGVGGYWNGCRAAATHVANAEGIDDVGFVRRLVGDLAESGRIDARRVFATGYSNGGHMAFRLALEAPDLVAGIATFSASLPADGNLDCDLSDTPVRTAILNGTEDPINPFHGGEVSLFGFGSLGEVRSSGQSAGYFRELHGATGAAATRTLVSGPRRVRVEEWSRGGTPVVSLLTVVGGGHTIPQTTYRFPRLLGPTVGSDAVIDYLWEFLRDDRPAERPAAGR